LTAIDACLYLFGGEQQPRMPIDNDVWQFNTIDNHWQRMTVVQGDRPLARLAHAAAAIEHK
jgi:N-acetylneuraminic acid mutarotase